MVTVFCDFKGFGFVTMEKSSDAMKAREALNGKAFDGRRIEVRLTDY